MSFSRYPGIHVFAKPGIEYQWRTEDEDAGDMMRKLDLRGMGNGTRGEPPGFKSGGGNTPRKDCVFND